MGVGFGEVFELYELEQAGHFFADSGFRRALGTGQHGEAEGDVVGHVHVTEEGVVLEDEADFSLAHVLAGYVLAVEQDLAAVGVFQPGDDAQQGGFAAAGGAQQGDELAGGHFEADVLQGVEAAEVFVDVLDGDAHCLLLAAAASLRFWMRVRMSCSTSVAMASTAKRLERAKAAVKRYSL